MEKIIIYDFDGTLTPYPVPRFEILEKCGIKDEGINEFYIRVKKKAINENIELYQALYEIYFETIKNAGFDLTDNNLCLGHDNVKYNNGVLEFLEMVSQNEFKNYLLSSGLTVFLSKTQVAPFFKKIYATTFNYNENGEVVSVDYLMSDKNKVDAIKEIMKENNIKSDDCSDIIYVGDGLTDCYAMEYVNKNNGTTIFVYQDENSKDVLTMRGKDVVSFYTKADFSLTGELTEYIKNLTHKLQNR